MTKAGPGDRFEDALHIKGMSRRLLTGLALDLYGRQGNWAAGAWVAESLGCAVDPARRAMAAWRERGILREAPMLPGQRARKAYAPADRQALDWMGRVALGELVGVPLQDVGDWRPAEWELMLALAARNGAATAADFAHGLTKRPLATVEALLEQWAAVDVVEVRFGTPRGGGPPLKGYRCSPDGRRWMSEQIVLVRAKRGELVPAPAA